MICPECQIEIASDGGRFAYCSACGWCITTAYTEAVIKDGRDSPRTQRIRDDFENIYGAVTAFALGVSHE